MNVRSGIIERERLTTRGASTSFLQVFGDTSYTKADYQQVSEDYAHTSGRTNGRTNGRTKCRTSHSQNVSRQSRKFHGLSQKFHGLTEKSHGLSEMFHGRPPFLPFSWQASPCVAEHPGVTFGATTGATTGAT